MTVGFWDVLGIGDADVDLFVKVEHLPGHDEKVMGQYLGEYPGGMIANFCCAASRFGARTALATVVGEDRYGEMAIAGLQEYGVAIDEVRVRPGGRTYFCIVLLDGSGEKALTIVETDCLHPNADDIDVESCRRARLVHLMASKFDFATWIAREAKKRGALVSLDLEPSMIGPTPSSLSELLCNVDLAFPNEAALCRVSSGSTEESARLLLEMGPSVVVVTRGVRGCLITATSGEELQIPAFRVPVADTTGAGDCFIGAFVVGSLRGWDLLRCGRFAAAAAALSVTKVGSRSALPHISDVESYLASNPETY
jgi:ribokinase